MRVFRTKLQMYSNVWKMILTFAIPTALFSVSCPSGMDCLETLYFRKSNATVDTLVGLFRLVSEKNVDGCSRDFLPFIIAFCGVLSGGLGYQLCKISCKILTQVFDFSLSLVLSTPVTIAIILTMYSGYITSSPHEPSCNLPFPKWSNESATDDIFPLLIKGNVLYVIGAALLGFLSLLIVTNHIWKPGSERLQSTDKYVNFTCFKFV